MILLFCDEQLHVVPQILYGKFAVSWCGRPGIVVKGTQDQEVMSSNSGPGYWTESYSYHNILIV